MSDFVFRRLGEVDLQGKLVLMRSDYNVPMKDGRITNDLRIRASLPTLRYLLKNGARGVVVISHLGKPKGEVVPELSLAPVAKRLEELLNASGGESSSDSLDGDGELEDGSSLEDKGSSDGEDGGGSDAQVVVDFCPVNTGTAVQDAVANLPRGGVLLLENLRFEPGEEENSLDFAAELAQATGAEVFVQDGFAVVHRAHASTSAIMKYLPAVAGLLLEKEVASLSNILHNPEKPFVIVVGGSKVDDKSPLIEKLAPEADKVFVGGKIAADGYATDDAKIDVADSFVTDENGAKLDVAPEWVESLIRYIEDNGVKTVLWNGTLGKVEEERFAKGSRLLAEYLGRHPEITTVICGGDTAGFVENLASAQPELRYSLISTGGGASLEFLSGEELPGVVALAMRG